MTPTKRSILMFALLALALSLMAVTGRSAGPIEAAGKPFYLPAIYRSLPRVDDIQEPLLIDGEKGRMYATATVNGRQQTVALATADGRYLDSYPYTGRLALDRSHHWLLIDQGDEGVVILDSLNGQRQGVIALPSAGPPPADPQINASQGLAYIFRGHTAYSLDIQSQRINGSRAFSVPLLVCGEPQGAAPITRSFYDLVSNTLYVSFNTWVCTGFLSDTIHIYDAASWHKWGEYSTPSHYQAAPFAANLYGLSRLTRLTMHVYWARSLTQTWYEENGGGDSITLAGNVIDWSRALLYEAVWEYRPGGEADRLIRVSRTDDRSIVAIVDYGREPVQDARLVGHDPYTDQLYFLDGGSLVVVPTKSILPVD